MVRLLRLCLLVLGCTVLVLAQAVDAEEETAKKKAPVKPARKPKAKATARNEKGKGKAKAKGKIGGSVRAVGQVVQVLGSTKRIAIRVNSTVKWFKLSGDTKITGLPGITSLNHLVKGQTVTVTEVRKSVSSPGKKARLVAATVIAVEVTKQPPPAKKDPPAKVAD